MSPRIHTAGPACVCTSQCSLQFCFYCGATLRPNGNPGSAAFAEGAQVAEDGRRLVDLRLFSGSTPNPYAGAPVCMGGEA